MERDRSVPKAQASPPGDDEAASAKTDQERWERALGNPEAQAFLRSALEQERRLEKEGVIHGP
jgi:hypothetical protein